MRNTVLAMMMTSAIPASAATKVHVHTSGEAGFLVNAYLIETGTGVVAVDSAFTVSEAKALRAKLDALKKPLLAVLVTHAHPDHVNGVGGLVAGADVPVIAMASSLACLKAIDKPKRDFWKPHYGAEYPDSTVFPNRVVRDGEVLTLGGARLQVLDLGPGESEAQTVFVLNDTTAFVGDLVMNGVHPWLAEGRSAAWIESLRSARRRLGKVTTAHPGHGRSGSLDILAAQERYLEAYRTAVKDLARGSSALSADQKVELEKRMEAFLPSAPLKMLVGLSADAVAGELATPRK